MSSYWMNVDRPTKLCILHRASCVHTHRRGEAGHKGVNVMERDGGWFEFPTESEASRFFAAQVRQYGIERVKQCDDCY